MSELYDAIRAFWLRDYRQDVSLLNDAIKKRNAASAGLENVPPSVLTGDPFDVVPGECMMVIGKNPKWRAGGLAGRWARADVLQAMRYHAALDFESYRRQRATYFCGNDPQHHGGHFTTLGNLLRREFFGGTIATANEFFRTKVAVTDVIPWWSVGTNDIDPTKLSLPLDPLNSWRDVVCTHVWVLRPKLVLVHGLGFVAGAEAILETKFHEFVWGRSAKGNRVRALAGRLADGTPVLGHALVTERRAWPSGKWSYSDLVEAWQQTPVIQNGADTSR